MHNQRNRFGGVIDAVLAFDGERLVGAFGGLSAGYGLLATLTGGYEN